jgi:hypothetical protein
MAQRFLLVLENSTARRFNDLAAKIQEKSVGLKPARPRGRPRKLIILDPKGRKWLDDDFKNVTAEGRAAFTAISLTSNSQDEINATMQAAYSDFINKRVEAKTQASKTTELSFAECKELALQMLLDAAEAEVLAELASSQ